MTHLAELYTLNEVIITLLSSEQRESTMKEKTS